jgi:hypothetical protein
VAWRLPTDRVSKATLLGGAWFGLGLLALVALLFALAGTLTLWGDWLEARWGLTFPTPLSAPVWFAAAAAPLILILLYFLKLKRKLLEVPSTFLWRKSIEDLHVNSFFQWLRKNILLLLQLLILVLLGYSLANPTHNSEARGRRFIFLLDNSASMAATDVKPTRLDEAKARVRKQIEALDDSDLAMLIAFNSEAQIVQSYSNRKQDLLRALDRIPQTQRQTRLDQALVLAEGQANPRRSTEEGAVELPTPGQMGRSITSAEGLAAQVILYSDGRAPDLVSFTPGLLRLRLDPIGTAANNLGITHLALRRDELRLDQFDVTVRVQNFTDQRVTGRLAVQLEVYGPDGRLDRLLKPVNLMERSTQEVPVGNEGFKRKVTIPGNATPEPIVGFTIKDPIHGYVKASLIDTTTAMEYQDDFLLDNRAWLAITPVRRARVLHIGPPNEILEAFFKASEQRQRVKVTRLSGPIWLQEKAYQDSLKDELFDLVVFDRAAPPTMQEMPLANGYFVGSAPPLPGLTWADLPTLSGLFIKEFRTAHPLLRGIETLQGMTIREARVLPRNVLPQRATPLLETQSEPVLWALGRGRYTDLVQTFSFVEGGDSPVWNTNWPKQPAGTLPLFLDNVLTQLGRYQEFETPTRPGQAKAFAPGVVVTGAEIKLVDPPGPAAEIQHSAGRELVYNAPEAVGLYEARWGEPQPYRFAVNLFDVSESDLEPRTDLLVGDERISTEPEVIRKRQELWPWLAAAALALFFLEWILYQRRVAV